MKNRIRLQLCTEVEWEEQRVNGRKIIPADGLEQLFLAGLERPEIRCRWQELLERNWGWTVSRQIRYGIHAPEGLCCLATLPAALRAALVLAENSFRGIDTGLPENFSELWEWLPAQEEPIRITARCQDAVRILGDCELEEQLDVVVQGQSIEMKLWELASLPPVPFWTDQSLDALQAARQRTRGKLFHPPADIRLPELPGWRVLLALPTRTMEEGSTPITVRKPAVLMVEENENGLAAVSGMLSLESLGWGAIAAQLADERCSRRMALVLNAEQPLDNFRQALSKPCLGFDFNGQTSTVTFCRDGEALERFWKAAQQLNEKLPVWHRYQF